MTLLKLIRDRIAFWRWYLVEFRPIAGGAPDDDDDTDKGGGGDKGGSGDDAEKGKGKDDDADKGSPEIPAGKVLADENELNRLKRIASEKDEADRKRKREEDEAAGRHNEVVQGVESERDDEKTKREKAEAETESLRREITVKEVAGRLKFNDPADALLHLPSDTPNDEKAIERALKKVAEEKQYLVGGQGSRTAAPGGGGDPKTPPDIDDQIRQAEKDGDVALSTSLKRQKLLLNKS